MAGKGCKKDVLQLKRQPMHFNVFHWYAMSILNEKTINLKKYMKGTVSMYVQVAVLIEGKLKQLLSISYLEQIAWKIIETFACVFRLNVAAGLVFIGVGNALWASLLTLMIQWGLGNVLQKKLFCADQISVIWGQSAENNIMLNIFSGFCIEVILLFVIVLIWNQRKEWK